MRKFRYLLIIGIIVLDQLVKLCIRHTMYVGQSITVIDGIFNITYVQNRGAAFNLFSGQGFMLVVVPVIAVSCAIWYMEKHINSHWTLYFSLCLIIAGGIGNLIDRVTNGFVTDMFDFKFWPVFNVADVAVCVGAGFLIAYTLIFMDKETIDKSEA